MPVLVRPAKVQDQEAVLDLLVEITSQHAAALPGIYREIAPSELTATYVRRIIESDTLMLSVAEQDGRVIGFVTFQEEQAPETPVHVPRRWTTISLIVIHRPFRSHGVGRALIEHVRGWSQSRGVDTIELQVAEFNAAAIGWYEALGFTSQYRLMSWSAKDP